MPKFDLPVKAFKTQKDWEKWLAKNHSKPEGIWIKFYKKASGIKTVVYAQALDVALMYGWIDGQVKSLDAKSYVQRFTPRRKRSAWSKRNVEHIARLTKLRLMKPAGHAAVLLAKQSGAWDNAYHSPKTAVMPKDFLQQLSKNKKARAFYESLPKSTLYSIYYRLDSAKRPETKQKRTKMIIRLLAKRQKPSIY